MGKKKAIIKKKSTTDKIIKKGTDEVKSIVVADNNNFKECLNIVANTKEGKYVLNRLMENCGFLKSSVVQIQDGTVDENTVQYREGRRSIWIYELYRFLNKTNLKEILFFDRRKLCKIKKKIQEKS